MVFGVVRWLVMGSHVFLCGWKQRDESLSISHYPSMPHSPSLGVCPSFLLCWTVTGSLWEAINSWCSLSSSLSPFLSFPLSKSLQIAHCKWQVRRWLRMQYSTPLQPTAHQQRRLTARAQQINSAWRASPSPAKSKAPRELFSPSLPLHSSCCWANKRCPCATALKIQEQCQLLRDPLERGLFE